MRQTPTFLFFLGLLSLGLVLTASVANANIVGVSDGGPCEAEPVAATLGEPFGFVDGNLDGGVLGVGGIVPLVGWALDDDGIARVDVVVDGRVIGAAEYGRQRADVAAFFPTFPGAAFSGWFYNLNTTSFVNGEHEVTARAISNTGEVRQLNTIVFFFQNNSHNLRPFGTITFPDQSATLYGTCDITDSDRIYSVVQGWALDVGVETNDHGIGWVELMVDGAIIANSRLNCRNSLITGAWSNCYGLPILGLETEFPGVRDAPNAGFRFVLDVGALIDFGYAEGQHVLTVRANDLDTQFENIATLNVNFECDEFTVNQPAIGAIDNESFRDSGIIQISGWALDREPVQSVRVYIDGDNAGLATYGFPRPAITSQYPSFPDSANPEWQLAFDTRTLSNGFHTALAVVTDIFGSRTTIGEITFHVQNP
ncbi:MAG: hypothetical protein DWQ36_01495 [Acidobacteria bacterium]|nr:MAG: hypothetical protein DWQ30_14285 [Acidobacteriota bacterium]REK11685.1 MAG: hypothetical protein DWQ36_01495 [Acidobacteriota bacterium]